MSETRSHALEALDVYPGYLTVRTESLAGPVPALPRWPLTDEKEETQLT
jgi:hypothetical protein